MSLIGQRLSERYEILSVLGRGGMGVVYRAHDPLLDREVAVKLVSLAQLSSEAEARFRREARLVANMDHPSIVPIYDLGSHLDALFFVMPVIEGETLKSLIRKRSLVLDDTLDIIAQVAAALDYSHVRGVVHRDIKPANVMVSLEGGSEGRPRRTRARVMDFGLALGGAHSRLTQTGKLPGTLFYLSPEQILSAEIDGRSDLFALGTILYECLAGEPPFSGSRYTLLYRIAHEEAPPLVARGVAPELAALVARCLAKDPAHRPARGNELVEALSSLRSNLGAADRRRPARLKDPRRGTKGGLRRAPTAPLAGRRREAAILARSFEESLAGDGRFVLLGGEAGMGKTRLLEEVEAAAAQGGAEVLHGRFSAGAAFPHQGFGELFLDYYRRRSRPLSDSSTFDAAARAEAESAAAETAASELPDLRDLSADLLALFPMLREIPALRESAPETAPRLSSKAAAADPTRIFELLARALLRLSGGRPLVLLLEHLHNTEASIEALQYIVHRLGPTPTLVVATYRPSEIDRRHPLSRLLRSFQGDPRFSSFVLAPLDRDEHRELLTTLLAGAAISEDLEERLYHASEGNPFFVQEWVRWLLETGDIKRLDDGTWGLASGAAIAHDALPESIQRAVESRLELLPEDLLRPLQTASILGQGFELADLEALHGDDTDEAVDELVHQGLLEEDPAARQDRLLFTSRLMREALENALPRRRRRALHRRHAEHLESRFAGRRHRVYPRLVDHFAAGDVPEKTIRYAIELARRALAGFGWESAANAIRTALDFVEDSPAGAGDESELRRLLAAALRAEGSAEAALKEAMRAARLAERATALAPAAAAAGLAAEIAWQIRRIEETRHWVARSCDLARRAGDAETLRSSLTLAATLANLGGEYDQARRWLAEATELGGEAKTEEAEEAPPPGGTLVASLPQPLRAFEWRRSPSPEEAEVLANVYETLVGSDSEGHLVPVLSRAWERAEKDRRFDFLLRPEVRFSDGEPMLASAVVASFEAVMERCEALPALGLIAALEAPEPHRVRFRLREAMPLFPALLTDPRTAIERRVDGHAEGRRHALGTGPFRFAAPSDAGQTEDVVILERNPHHWREPTLVDRVELRVIPHSNDVARALRSGEVDLGGELLPAGLEEILRDPRFRSGLREATSKSVCFVLFRGKGVLESIDVRRALSRGVRVQDLVWRALGRTAQPANGMIPPGVLAHDPGRRRPASTRQEASQIVAESGTSSPLRLRGGAHPDFLDRYRALTEALFKEWAGLGVEAKIELLDPELLDEEAFSAPDDGFDFLLLRREPRYDDPDNFTHAVLLPWSGPPATDLVTSGLYRLLRRARREIRPAVRQKLYRRIESLLDEEAIVLPLFHDIHYRIAGPRVRRLRLLGSPPFVDYAAIGKAAGEHSPPALLPSLGHTGTLRVALPGRLSELDPASALSAPTGEIVPNVFETLTRIDEAAHIVPGLASELRAEEGGRRYRFRLRSGARFHDGRRLSVRDVRFSFERLLEGKGHAAIAAELVGLDIVSEREIVLELAKPLSFFPAMLASAGAAIVPEGSTVFDGSWRQGTAGTGPFRVVRLGAGKVELEANPHYWRAGRPRCDRLTFEFGLEPERVVADFRAGRLSLASHLRPRHVEALLHDPELAAGYLEAPGFSTCYLVLNCHRGQLADLELRRALAELLRPDDSVAATLGRLAVPARGLIPPGLLGQAEPLPSGPAPGQGGRLAGLKLKVAAHPSYRETWSVFWQWLRERLESAGVELEEAPFETGSAGAVSTGDDPPETGGADLVATRWLADYTDSDSFARVLHSRGGRDGALCGSPRIDRLIERGRRESHPALRHAAYAEIERQLREEARVIPLFHEQIYRFARPEVRGLRLGLRMPEVAYEELSLAV